MLQQFLSNDGSDIKFTGHHMDIFIPIKYIDQKIAAVDGKVVDTFGVLPCIVYDSKDKIINRDVINIPSQIFLFPTDIFEEDSNPLGIEEYGVQRFIVCRFFNGDIVMHSGVKQDSNNVQRFLDLIVNGKLDGCVPYDKLLSVWLENNRLNSTRLNVSSLYYEVILAAMYRNRSDLGEKFGVALDKNPKLSPYAYTQLNIRGLCAQSSTFAAITFEDMDRMITSSINMNKYNRVQDISPLEKILKL